jgi:hypothetical protein
VTLPVPLTVRVGDELVTQEVQSLSFRKEAVGGCRSIAFSLARSLASLGDVDPLARVYVYDGRSAATVVEGRLSDTGRGATADGERWDCVAFGPAQHASDITIPSVFIERSLSDGWRLVDVVHADATTGPGAQPGDTGASPVAGILASFSDGININLDSRAVWRYEALWRYTGQKLGGFQFNWDTSITNADWRVEAVTRTDAGAAAERAYQTAWDTAGGGANGIVGTDFPDASGRNTVELNIRWNGGAATTSGETWGFFYNVVVRPQLKQKDGTDLPAVFHANSYILAYNVVDDLLGRLLPEYDGANAVVSGGTTYQITQLAYHDGVTPAQVLDDLMAMEPAYRWTTGPDITGNGHQFRWEEWPTTVRYEATLDDGGSFPLSAQGLYNEVWVRWVASHGGEIVTILTGDCPLLDEHGLRRVAFVDLGTEVGSEDNANQVAEAFLEEHRVPKNAGTLTVARPIRDLSLGTLVQPWEIEAGELVRIRGVEAYPDAFNADTNDGQGVFRIHAVDYTTEGNVATLALDSDARETEDALVKLMKQRTRR